MSKLFLRKFFGVMCVMLFSLVSVSSVVYAQVPASTAPTGSSLADCGNGIKTLGDLLLWPACIASRGVIPLLVLAALLLFMVGIVRFLANPEDTKMRQQFLSFAGWGIGAIFIMLSLWGIIYFISNTLNIGVGGTGPVPKLYDGK